MDDKRELYGKYYMLATMALWFSTEILFNSMVTKILWWKKEDVNSFMAILVLLLLLVEIIFLQHYSFNELAIIVIFSIPILIGTLNSNNNVMVSAWLFIVASKYVDFDKIAKMSYYVLLIMILVVMYLYFQGVIDETTIYRGAHIRHSLGFSHPNWLGIRTFQLVLSRAYVRRHKFSIVDYAIVILAILFIYWIPNSQTAYYSLIIFLLLKILYDCSDLLENGQVYVARIMIGIAAFSNVFSVFMSFINLRKNFILIKLDKLLSYRFSNCHRTIRFYGVSWLGRNIELYGRRMNSIVRKFYIDTAYVSILLRYGIIVFLLFSMLYLATMIYLLKSHNYFLILILCLYAIYGIMENSLYSMTQNIFLITLSYPIYNKVMNTEEFVLKRRRRIKFIFQN